MTTEQQIDSQELPYQAPLLSADEQLYIRSVIGECKYLPVTEAVNQFISDDGYRISFEFANGVTLVIRRDSSKPPVDFVENSNLNSLTFECEVTVRGHLLNL